MTILLVEDDTTDVALTTRLLRQQKGFNSNIRLAGSLAESAALLNSDNQYDVVILDLHLPDSNGLDTST